MAKKKAALTVAETIASSTKSERSEQDSVAPMGYGATRSLERVAAAIGELSQAPIKFERVQDVPQGGVLLALARIKSVEQLRYSAPGEWGKLLGLDRVPEVRTLREKLKILCAEDSSSMVGRLENGHIQRWNAKLAEDWLAVKLIRAY